jgi:hypothetical protein
VHRPGHHRQRRRVGHDPPLIEVVADAQVAGRQAFGSKVLGSPTGWDQTSWSGIRLAPASKPWLTRPKSYQMPSVRAVPHVLRGLRDGGGNRGDGTGRGASGPTTRGIATSRSSGGIQEENNGR